MIGVTIYNTNCKVRFNIRVQLGSKCNRNLIESMFLFSSFVFVLWMFFLFNELYVKTLNVSDVITILTAIIIYCMLPLTIVSQFWICMCSFNNCVLRPRTCFILTFSSITLFVSLFHINIKHCLFSISILELLNDSFIHIM